LTGFIVVIVLIIIVFAIPTSVIAVFSVAQTPPAEMSSASALHVRTSIHPLDAVATFWTFLVTPDL
jgi:uncharacterized protein YpmB